MKNMEEEDCMRRRTVFSLLLVLALLVSALALLPAAGMADPPDDECSSPNSGDGHHVWELQESIDATCTTDGGKYWMCKYCGRTYAEEYKANENAHSWSAWETFRGQVATCTEQGQETRSCSICGTVEYRDTAALGHDPEVISGKAATCTEPGLTEGSKCKRCGTVITAQTEIPAKGHSAETIPGKAATCTETGLTEGSKCSVCGTILTAQTEIPAKGHSAETIPGKAATCTEAGLTDGSKCSVCGAILTAQSEIPAKGHTAEAIPGKAATCTETGLTDGSKCSVCGTILTAQSEIPAKGHTAETIPGKAATCTEAGLTDGSKCSVCGTVITAQSEIPAKGHTATTIPGKAATCTEAGLTDGSKCSVCGTILTAQTEIPAKGHTATAIPGKAATCTEAGLTDGSKCSVCGTILAAQSEIPAKGHTPTAIPAVSPTCTATGLTEGSKCSVCGAILTAQQEVPLWGHNWDEGEVTKEPGYLNPGEKTYRCSRCGATKTEEIPADTGTSMYNLLRNNVPPIPGDPAGKGPDEDEELHIVFHPRSGFIDEHRQGDQWLILTVEAAGGVEPYSYTWYKVRTKVMSEAAANSNAFSGFFKAWGSLSGKYAEKKESGMQSFSQFSDLADLAAAISVKLSPTGGKPISTLLDEEILYNDVDNYWADEPGSYYVVVTDAEGHTVKSDTAWVRYSLRITSQSDDIYTCGAATGFAFVNVIGGTPPYKYQWYEDHGAYRTPIEGATNPTVELPACDNYDDGPIIEDVGDTPLRGYLCEIYDSGNGEWEMDCQTERIRLYKEEPLRIVAHETQLYMAPGEFAQFDYMVCGGHGKITLDIIDDHEELINHSELPSAEENGSPYHYCNFIDDVYGLYTLTATDEAGATDSIQFSFDEAPLAIAEQPIGGELPFDGSGVKVRIEMAEGTAPFTYTLQSPYYPTFSLTQNSPEFIIKDEKIYQIYVKDADGRYAFSDLFFCTGYDADFTDGCLSDVEYIYDPESGAWLCLNPIGSQYPYTVRWSYRPVAGSGYAYPLDCTDMDMFAYYRGEYLYEITDKNGQVHNGSIKVVYAGDTPWILSSPKSVDLQNNLENEYTTVFTCDAVGSSGTSAGLRFTWQRGFVTSDYWEDVKLKPGVYEQTGKVLTVHGSKDTIGWHYRCKVTDMETGKDACTDPAFLRLEMYARVEQYKNNLEVYVEGGKEPYHYEVSRHRDGYYPPNVIALDNHRYIEEDYPLKGHKCYANPPGTYMSFDLVIYDVDLWASDWYKSSYAGIKKHYHRFAWTYDIVVTDQNGAQTMCSVTCTFDKPLEWASCK